ncbi:hypothetical protein [Curtobacterium flaccumfaciens]|uniref:hypothetical protein n=1 Tax=Curtobacterium flaccumfaciens TaxID=2035 RepID=UPI003EB9039D
MSTALDRLRVQLGDVDNLITHHSSGGAVGRPAADEGPLNRSCVVLTYAAWEVYAEDSLVWAAERVATRPTFASLPEATRQFIADKAASDPASLADDGWREAVVEQVVLLTRGDPTTGDFGINTAGPRQLVSLHESILGDRLLNKVKWPKKDNESVKKSLLDLVRERGSIVHTGTPRGALHLKHVRDHRNFVERLAEGLDAEIEQWVTDAGATLV